MAERKTYTIRMQPEIMKALKILSVEKSTNVSELIEEAMQDLLRKSGIDNKKMAKK
jgi:predicted DNA-binding protein